jgi:hypothetical protein
VFANGFGKNGEKKKYKEGVGKTGGAVVNSPRKQPDTTGSTRLTPQWCKQAKNMR